MKHGYKSNRIWISATVWLAILAADHGRWKQLHMPQHPLVTRTITVVWQKAARREPRWEGSLCLALACHMVCLFPSRAILWIQPWCKHKPAPPLFIIQETSSANKWQTIISNTDALFTLSLWSHFLSNSLNKAVYFKQWDVGFYQKN